MTKQTTPLEPSTPNNYLQAFLWITLLGFVATALHNFALSLSVDGTLYANIAKNITLSRDWFRLDSGVPEFQPYFAEHPHFGFWVYANFVKLFGTDDWSMRIPGHFLYVLTVFLFFFWIKKQTTKESQAHYVFVVVLWIFPLFSRFFGQVYLDPLYFFFGALAVFLFERSFDRDKKKWVTVALAHLSGMLLAFSAMTKGLSFLGFGPIMAFICAQRFYRGQKNQAVWYSLVTVFTMTSILFLYYLAVKSSTVPDFFDTYFKRQWHDRFSTHYDWRVLFSFEPWLEILLQTNFLAAIIPLLLFIKKFKYPALKIFSLSELNLGIPFVGLFSFMMMYFPVGKFSAQYAMTTLPWLAWLIAIGINKLIEPKQISKRLMTWTSIAAVIALMISNFIPITIRKTGGPFPLALTLKSHLDRLDQNGTKYRLSYIHQPKFGYKYTTFIPAANWSWYTKREFLVTNEQNLSFPESNIIVVQSTTQKTSAYLKEHGFCPLQMHKSISVWTGCQFQLIQPALWSN